MNDAEALLSTRFVFVPIMLLALAGCATIGKVDLPDPTSVDQKGHVRHFNEIDADRVLLAAETVLRRHRPEGSIVRERDTVVMEYRWQAFYAFMAGYERERWVIAARKVGEMTAASVAMRYASEGYVWPISGVRGEEYPHEAGWRGEEVDVDYGMFWRQLESVLRDAAWPECEKVKYESGFRYFEPICRHKTVKQLDPR